jgi:outer membrane receptor protein involved in Fe transport
MILESSKELTMTRSIRKLCIFGCCLIALLVIVAGSATAQTFRGTILGTVTDSSGGTVPGATVTIKNVDTGLTRTLTTSDDGSYSAPELPIGNYSVTVEKQGFKTGLISRIKVEVSTERRADFTLQTGELSQKVEVLGEELPMVETTSNNMGGIVEANTVENLPVNGRDYQKLILLVPGASSDSNGITDSPGSFGTVSVNGARGRSNNYLLDGTDMNDGYRNDPAINEGGVFGTPATILPIEAIAEVHVASNFEAEYGRSAGAAINIVTKSGTNDWHGSAFDYLRNTALNARNFFDLASVGPQQPFHLNQFGGSFGGPIKHDKTFFFVDYEAVRETGAESSPGCVPIAADISANAPTPGDLTSINPVIQNLLKLNPWPAATNPNVDCYANGGGTNVTISTPFSNRVDNAIVKIDHEFNKNNMFTGRYYIGDSTQLFPLALTGGGDLPNYSTRVPTRVQLISLSYVSVLSPAIVNEARLGWNRFAEGFFAQDSSFDPNSIGLDVTGPGTPNNSNPYNFGMPVINVAGLPQLGSDKADPRQRVDTNWHYMDNISWKSGKHDIKFGYEFRRTSISQIFDRVFRGKLGFDSLSTFLQGIPETSPFHSLQVTGDTNRNTFENSHAFYLQDSYRLSRRLTLNLGLRYDYFGIIQEKHGMFTNVDPTTGEVFPVGQGRLYQPDYKNWAPRFSVAWDVTGKGKTVVRTGFGIFYDSYSQDMFMGHLPFSSLFDPGPAYSGLPGVGQISLATPTPSVGNSSYGLPLALNQPIFTNFTPMADAFGVDPHIRTPYMENYNLNLQQQLTRKVVLQVGYVGSQGHKLLNFTDINQPSAAQIWAADCAGVAGVTFGQPCPSGTINDGSVPRRLTGNNITYIYWEGSGASSNYNSLQTTLRIDNWHGLTTGLSYTWSHSIDTASDGEDYVPNAAQPTDSTNPSSNRGNSNFDVRNRLSWNFNYEFPNRKGSLEKLTNGWGLDSIVTLQSGAPFSMILESDDYDGAGTYFPKPDIVGPIKYNYSDPTHFLDLSSFAAPCTPLATGFDGTANTCTPGTRHFGNEGRNSLIGPAFREVDFSIFKRTSLTERLKMELRFEAYNLFNHPNFASPLWPNFLSDPTFTNSFGPNGRLQGFLPISVTADVGAGYPVVGGGGPRSLQVAAKFTF